MAEPGDGTVRKPKLLQQVRLEIGARQFSPRTEEAYVSGIRRYILFHGKRHPAELNAAAVTAFLSDLACTHHVSAATQNQAASALLFLYREVLNLPVETPRGILRPAVPRRLPIVLTRQELRAVLGEMRGLQRLIAHLLYGSGLRLMEAVQLRVKDVQLDRLEIMVRDGKGGDDRITMLPRALPPEMAKQIALVKERHRVEAQRGAGWVALPAAMAHKAPAAARHPAWQWVFPATRRYTDPATGRRLPPPPAREFGTARSLPRGPHGRHSQARHLPHLPPLLRDAPARGWLRHPHDPGTPRPSRCENDNDLHPRPQPRRPRRP